MPLIMMYPRPRRLEFYFRPEGGERSDEQLATALYSDYPAFSFPAFSFSFLESLIIKPRTFLTQVENSPQIMREPYCISVIIHDLQNSLGGKYSMT